MITQKKPSSPQAGSSTRGGFRSTKVTAAPTPATRIVLRDDPMVSLLLGVLDLAITDAMNLRDSPERDTRILRSGYFRGVDAKELRHWVTRPAGTNPAPHYSLELTCAVLSQLTRVEFEYAKIRRWFLGCLEDAEEVTAAALPKKQAAVFSIHARLEASQ